MPLIASKYKTPLLFLNADLQTIAPSIFRRVTGVNYVRERIITPDDDFLDIDWLHNHSKKIVLLIHGLEASAHMPYMKGMAKTFFNAGYHVAAMNLRGCSGELNKQVRAYHSGATDDVETTVNHILQNYTCDEMAIIGFSLGANLTLKFIGEQSHSLSSKIKAAVAISAPCDLEAAVVNLDRPIKYLYRHHFLRTLRKKAALRIHHHHFPLNEKEIKSVTTLAGYDNKFTAPLFGFKDAYDYYRKSSSKQFLQHITIPTLILTAQDDPFFTESCLPYRECKNHEHVFLETPKHGGHVGFIINSPWGNYYSEKRALEFVSSHLTR